MINVIGARIIRNYICSKKPMKARTLIELLTLSSNLYLISKDKVLMEKFHHMADKGKEKINEFMSSSMKDEHGEEMEFLQKLSFKAHEVKDELEAKISELVQEFYKKVNIVHTNEIKSISAKLEELSKVVALLEARLNKYETKQQ
jgi:polyhydroxyalkanoate synthesis regulator phasin